MMRGHEETEINLFQMPENSSLLALFVNSWHDLKRICCVLWFWELIEFHSLIIYEQNLSIE